jgi:hypothetical protein
MLDPSSEFDGGQEGSLLLVRAVLQDQRDVSRHAVEFYIFVSHLGVGVWHVSFAGHLAGCVYW